MRRLPLTVLIASAALAAPAAAQAAPRVFAASSLRAALPQIDGSAT
jgi:ABC-type molybdate transport system substrate-binding protein